MDALRCANCHKYIPSKEMPTTEEYSPAIGESFNYYCKDCLKKLQEQGIIQTKQRRDNMADITKPQNLEDMYLEPFILKQFNITLDQLHDIMLEYNGLHSMGKPPMKNIILNAYRPTYHQRFTKEEKIDSIEELGRLVLSQCGIPELKTDKQTYTIVQNSSLQILVCEDRPMSIIEFVAFKLNVSKEKIVQISATYSEVLQALKTIQTNVGDVLK